MYECEIDRAREMASSGLEGVRWTSPLMAILEWYSVMPPTDGKVLPSG